MNSGSNQERSSHFFFLEPAGIEDASLKTLGLVSTPVGQYTCWSVHLLVSTPVGQCTCWSVHLLVSAPVGQYTCWSVHLLPWSERSTSWTLRVGVLMRINAAWLCLGWTHFLECPPVAWQRDTETCTDITDSVMKIIPHDEDNTTSNTQHYSLCGVSVMRKYFLNTEDKRNRE